MVLSVLSFCHLYHILHHFPILSSSHYLFDTYIIYIKYVKSIAAAFIYGIFFYQSVKNYSWKKSMPKFINNFPNICDWKWKSWKRYKNEVCSVINFLTRKLIYCSLKKKINIRTWYNLKVIHVTQFFDEFEIKFKLGCSVLYRVSAYIIASN